MHNFDFDFCGEIKAAAAWAIVISWLLVVLGAIGGGLYLLGRILWGML